MFVGRVFIHAGKDFKFVYKYLPLRLPDICVSQIDGQVNWGNLETWANKKYHDFFQ